MRLPSRTELSPEQEKIFLDAPLNGVVVIVGPPGTGKTVMAVYRAKLLAKQKKPYRVIMYNKVLLSFTKRVMDGMEDNISTWHIWVYKWWQQAYCSRIPTLDRWTPDFVKAIEIYLTTEPTIPKNINWGHLIIDEGQDFPKSFYVLCNLVVSKPKAGKPSLTVLADENQRLDTEKNSTIQEIIEALSQPVTYSLTVNYRNTYEISHLTEHFYVGARSGIPDKPNGRA